MAELIDFLGNSCSLRIMLGVSVFHGGVEDRMGRQQCNINFYAGSVKDCR